MFTYLQLDKRKLHCSQIYPHLKPSQKPSTVLVTMLAVKFYWCGGLFFKITICFTHFEVCKNLSPDFQDYNSQKKKWKDKLGTFLSFKLNVGKTKANIWNQFKAFLILSMTHLPWQMTLGSTFELSETMLQSLKES